jgi:hypothetical protein
MTTVAIMAVTIWVLAMLAGAAAWTAICLIRRVEGLEERNDVQAQMLASYRQPPRSLAEDLASRHRVEHRLFGVSARDQFDADSG